MSILKRITMASIFVLLLVSVIMTKADTIYYEKERMEFGYRVVYQYWNTGKLTILVYDPACNNLIKEINCRADQPDGAEW